MQQQLMSMLQSLGPEGLETMRDKLPPEMMKHLQVLQDSQKQSPEITRSIDELREAFLHMNQGGGSARWEQRVQQLPAAQSLSILSMPLAYSMYAAQEKQTMSKAGEKQFTCQFWRSQQQKLVWTLQGGYKVPKADLIREWNQQVQGIMKMEQDVASGSAHRTTHSTADENTGVACTTPEYGLRSVLLKQLLVGRSNRGAVLWGEIIAPVGKMTGLSCVVADQTGDAGLLSLYNFVAHGCKTRECQKRFPLGTIFGIKEPYYKISNSGRLALRVDHPGCQRCLCV